MAPALASACVRPWRGSGRLSGALSRLTPRTRDPALQRCRQHVVRSNLMEECLYTATDAGYSVKSALGRTGGDPGHWNLSPEWMGTQGGGWGHNEGVTIFEDMSQHGNGVVSVTAHPAATLRRDSATSTVAEASACPEEWRVLRFNGTTRQSVARVTLSADGHVAAQPDCLAFEYMKSLAASAAVVIGSWQPEVQRACLAQRNSAMGDPAHTRRALCIGLGGGSLAMFLAHHWPGLEVDAVELDPLVLEAATKGMGCTPGRPGLQLHVGEAGAYMRQLAAKIRAGQEVPFSLVFVDAFDGEDLVPAHLTCAEGRFLKDLASALHPQHGAVILNMHSGPKAPLNPLRSGHRLACLDVQSFEGREVVRTAKAYRHILLAGCEHLKGTAYAVRALNQQNVAVVISRGLQLANLQPQARGSYVRKLAEAMGAAAGVVFPVGQRACAQMSIFE